MKVVACTILIILSLAFAAEDYYKILGIPKNADDNQIKKAFKKLSLKYHPDRNKDKKEWAKEQFVKIANAYETLSDPEKRRMYDLGGEEKVKEQEQRQNQGHGHFHGGFGGNFDDIFNSFFGNRGGGGGGRRQHHTHYNQEERVEKQTDFFDNTDVLKLNISSLGKILSRNENWFVIFYSHNDRDIKNLTDMWKTLADKTYGIFKVGACNCKVEEELCEEFSVRETPTILFFSESKEDEEKYTGLKTWEKIFQYGASRMQSFVRVINKENYGSFITDSPANHKVLLFTSKKVTPPLLKAISKKYLGKLSFGEVRDSETELKQRFKVSNLPTLLVISDPSNYESVKYDGPMSRDSIEKFLNKYAYEPIKVEKKIENASELTEKKYNSGLCNNNDGKNICFIFVVKSKNEIESKDMIALNQLATKYINDPFKFLYIIENNYGHLWSSFHPDDKMSDFIVIKGKRKKYIAEKHDTSNEWSLKAEVLIDKILSGSGDYKNLNKKLSFNTLKKDDL